MDKPNAAVALRAGLIALLLYALVSLARGEEVLQAQAQHGGSIVLTDRAGNCLAKHAVALDLRPAGARPAFVVGCYRVVNGGAMIIWRGWPGAFFYPRQAFVSRDRDLSWMN